MIREYISFLIKNLKLDKESIAADILILSEILATILKKYIEKGDIDFLYSQLESLNNIYISEGFKEELREEAYYVMEDVANEIDRISNMELDMQYLDDLFNIRKEN